MIFITIIGVLAIVLYPKIIAPLFNKYFELQSCELKDKIEQLSKRENFPMEKIYIADTSKRSSHANAYFYGFGSTKFILLCDNLLNFSHEEIIGILCTLSLKYSP